MYYRRSVSALLIALCLMAALVGCANAALSTVIFSDNFESALSWSKAGDVAWYTGTPKNNARSVRLRRTGSIEKSVPTTGYKNISVSFAMGTYSLDTNRENIQALYYNGTTWVLFAEIRNGQTNENNRLNAYTIGLPKASNLQSFALRFKLNGSGAGDFGYVDNVVVSGTQIQVPEPGSHSIWTPSAVPSIATENDAASVELGLKFNSAINGYVHGIRFYKGPQNTGTHVVTLWSNSGTQLARATASKESASGWQEARFSGPVSVTAGTTYVASYHTTAGYYSANGNYFTKDYKSAPLTALSSADSSGNGVYTYSQTPAFPSHTYNATNYWVDVVFSETGGQLDTVAPTIPSNVTAKSVSDRTVSLSWATSTDNVGIAGYTVYRDGAVVAATTATQYSDTGLAASTIYSYTVDAFDAGQNKSQASNSVDAETLKKFEVAAPVPPSAYAVPAGAIRVSSSSELISALNNNTSANIALADGTYDHSAAFSACSNKLWSENLLGATLTAGIEFGGNWCLGGGGELHGINFNVHSEAKTLQSAIVHAWGPGHGNIKIQDSVFQGNGALWHGVFILQPENAVIERNEFYRFLDTGLRISDTAYVGHVQYGGAVAAIWHISDILVDGASRQVPGSSNGTGEMGVWVGNPVTNGVQRIKVRNASVAGLQPVDNSRDTTFTDLDIDMTGPYASMGIALSTEHWGYNNTYTNFYLRGSRGFHCEWADPAWGGTPACRDTFVHTGVIDGTGSWALPSIGVNLDVGTYSTAVRNVRFIGQNRAAINVNNVEGAKALDDNDFTGIVPGALPIRYGHPYN